MVPPPWTLAYARVGNPSALLADGGVGGGSVIFGNSRIGKLLGKRFAAAIAARVIIKAFELGMWLRGKWEERKAKDALERRRRQEQWNREMWGNVWKGVLLTDLPPLAAEAFDLLAGGQVSHGTAPGLTTEALKEAQATINGINAGWLGYTERIQFLEGQISLSRHFNHGIGDETKIRAWMAEIDELNSKMQAEMDAVVSVYCNPANWDLTPEQVALLPEAWEERFERRKELEEELRTAHSEGLQRIAKEQLARVREEMAAAAGELYDYGPRASPDDPKASSMDRAAK